MSSFTPGTVYACDIPGQSAKMLFDCQAVIMHPDSRRTLGVGFTQYEGSGFWRDIPVNYRYNDKWSVHAAGEAKLFFLPGTLYEYRSDNHRAVAQFRCVGVDNSVSTRATAVGYYRRIRSDGTMNHWELTEQHLLDNWHAIGRM